MHCNGVINWHVKGGYRLGGIWPREGQKTEPLPHVVGKLLGQLVVVGDIGLKIHHLQGFGGSGISNVLKSSCQG